MRGYTVPAFSFEKLSPPVNPEPVRVVGVAQHRGSQPLSGQPRGILLQILDRLTEGRLRRTGRDNSSETRSGSKTG
jgi:hypothetical protein